MCYYMRYNITLNIAKYELKIFSIKQGNVQKLAKSYTN